MSKPVASVETLADYLVNGYWNEYDGGGPRSWASNTITYNLSEANATQSAAARLAFDEWARVANLTFVETTGTGDITIKTTAPGTGAFGGGAPDESGHMDSATITIASDWDNGNFGRGSYGYETMLHEIGHALGLGHQGPYDVGDGNDPATVTPWANGTRQFSVMSYLERDQYDGSTLGRATSIMLADIAAIQSMYGANYSAALGNTVYGFNATADGYSLTGDLSFSGVTRAFTIYDSGGIDTIDNSGSNKDSFIDLNGGAFSSIAGAKNNVAIHSTSIVENAVGGSRADDIWGNEVSNVLSGGKGADELYGMNGSDTLIGGAGNDYLAGGFGVDTASFATETAKVRADLMTGKALVGSDKAVELGFAEEDTLIELENLVGSEQDDELAGENGTNHLWGQGGNDQLAGRAGADVLDGGAGIDLVTYRDETAGVSVELGPNVGNGKATTSTGTDTLLAVENLEGSSFADKLAGDSGVNTLIGGSGDDGLAGRAGSDWLDGGEGSDTASYAGEGAVQADLASGKATMGADTDTLTSIEHLEGSAFADKLAGDAGNNRLDGLAGQDLLSGRAGSDGLHGGLGTDTATYEDEAAGVSADLATGKVTTSTGTDIVSSIENLKGSTLADELRGEQGVNQLDGLGGDDVLAGRAGGDFLNGGEGIDTATYIDETAGVSIDLAAGPAGGKATTSTGKDTLTSIENLEGSTFADELGGDAGSNRLDGLAGNDKLRGGDGVDSLWGGEGADTFVYDFVSHSGLTAEARDVIFDFSEGDRIDLKGLDADMTLGGDQAFEWLGGTRLTGAAQVSYASEGRNTVLQLSVDADASAEMTISLADVGPASLDIDDFLL